MESICVDLDFEEFAEMAETVFTHCLEGIKYVKSEEGDLMTKPFLDVCKLILPILGSFIFLMNYDEVVARFEFFV